jgi:hypothetical protein
MAAPTLDPADWSLPDDLHLYKPMAKFRYPRHSIRYPPIEGIVKPWVYQPIMPPIPLPLVMPTWHWDVNPLLAVLHIYLLPSTTQAR